MIAIKLSSTCVVYGTVPVSLLVSPLRDLPVFFLCWSVFQHCILNPVLLFHNAVALCSINSFPVTLWGMRIVPRSSALFSLQYFIALIHTQKPLIYIYIFFFFILLLFFNRLCDNRSTGERIQVHLFPNYWIISYIKVSRTCFGRNIWPSAGSCYVTQRLLPKNAEVTFMCELVQ